MPRRNRQCSCFLDCLCNSVSFRSLICDCGRADSLQLDEESLNVLFICRFSIHFPPLYWLLLLLKLCLSQTVSCILSFACCHPVASFNMFFWLLCFLNYVSFCDVISSCCSFLGSFIRDCRKIQFSVLLCLVTRIILKREALLVSTISVSWYMVREGKVI